MEFYTIDIDIHPAMAGNIENQKDIHQNGTVELIAHAHAGYKFNAWIVEDEIISKDTILSILLTQDTRLIAEFKISVSNENKIFENSPPLYISPNPAKMQIELSSDEISFDYISVVNLMGKEVLRINHTTSMFISIEKLPKGMYLLHAGKANRKYVAKFIKQ